MAREANIDIGIYRDPDPALVCRVIDEYGAEAAQERWHWMSDRRLASLAAKGRARGGVSGSGQRASSYDPLTIAVGIEAAFLLGSGTAGERAAGMAKANLLNHLDQRGLDNPAIRPEDRGRNSRDGAFAKRGDVDAIARVQARHAYEQAVGAVLRVAIPMVTEQPRTGRYRLPEVTPDLAAALAGHDPDAVATVFPALALPAAPAPTEAEWEAAATPTAPVTQETPMPFAPRVRSVPADDVIRAHHAETPRVADLAKRWSVTPACVYQHLRRLGLSSRPAVEASVPVLPPPAPAPEVAPSNVVPFEAPHPEPAPIPARAAAQWDLAFPSRLGLEDLVLAVALAQRTGLGAAEAIRFVRADAAAARPA